ncbi:hypothetical protein C4D60_Mb01t29750 [Musa balbisiana]|uniref:Uncharacterized protein n=1 Tax=Musa balbisiana TaxID=52838 RepID=A0A4S8JRP3_MUSBA|nr:hypothetical protein C4D60_Mb01t29750 [Musa balbisiana]
MGERPIANKYLRGKDEKDFEKRVKGVLKLPRAADVYRDAPLPDWNGVNRSSARLGCAYRCGTARRPKRPDRSVYRGIPSRRSRGHDLSNRLPPRGNARHRQRPWAPHPTRS